MEAVGATGVGMKGVVGGIDSAVDVLNGVGVSWVALVMI